MTWLKVPADLPPVPSITHAALPMGEPLLVREVFAGAAITAGPAVLAVFTDGTFTAALAWESAEVAHEHLTALLASVRAQLPPAGVVGLVPR